MKEGYRTPWTCFSCHRRFKSRMKRVLHADQCRRCWLSQQRSMRSLSLVPDVYFQEEEKKHKL